MQNARRGLSPREWKKRLSPAGPAPAVGVFSLKRRSSVAFAHGGRESGTSAARPKNPAPKDLGRMIVQTQQIHYTLSARKNKRRLGVFGQNYKKMPPRRNESREDGTVVRLR
jgi:hypothetical protein